MIRKAFLMRVHPGRQAEYERRHSTIWPEMEDTLRACGARNYSIFLDAGTNQLFAYVEIESEERWAAVARTEICRRWWASMAELMPGNPDGSPQVVDLRPVFHMD